MTWNNVFAAAALRQVFGRTAVVGGGARRIAALAASASELTAWAPADRVEAAAALARAEGLAAVIAGSMDDGGLPEISTISSLVVLDWPAHDDPLACLDRLLGRVADEGCIFVDLPARGPTARRFRMLFDGVVRDSHELENGDDRLVLVGVRDAPGREHPDVLVDDPVDVTAVVVVDRHVDECSLLCGDLLFGQNTPPSVVLVVDDTPAGDVPDDLWGMAASSEFTQPALLRTGGVGREEAIRIGLEHVESPAVMVLDATSRVAPAAVGALHRRLAAENGDVVAAAAPAYVETPAGLLVSSASDGVMLIDMNGPDEGHCAELETPLAVLSPLESPSD